MTTRRTSGPRTRRNGHGTPRAITRATTRTISRASTRGSSPNRTETAEPLLSRSDLTLLGSAAAAVAAGAVVLLGGALSGLVFGSGWALPPAASWLPTLTGLATRPASPAAAYPPEFVPLLPGPTPFWGTVTTLAVLSVLAAVVAGVSALGRRGQAGLATRSQVRRAGTADDAGAPFATYLGAPVRARGEDSALTIAPARAGKTTRLAAGRVVDAPGAVVATSTKADLVRLTAHARGRGRVHVFDPDRLLAWPTTCRWDATAGCADVREATTRARAMVAARPLGGGRNAGFFEGASQTVLAALLHAAALDGRSMADVLTWARDFTDDTPYDILRTHPGASHGWVDDLRTFCRAGAPETVSSTAMSLGLVLGALTDPAVLDLLCPEPGTGLDVEAFVRDGTDTLYLVSEGGAGVATAPLVTAFAAAVVTAARRHSQTTPTGRLDPPLTLVLDEAANVAPLPDLPTLMADGGGRGITTWAFVQSFAQLRTRWGRDGADTIWGATSIKLILGGCTEADDLERLSKLIGDRRVPRRSTTTPTGLLTRSTTGNASTSTSSERERVLPVEAIARIPTGQALMLYRALPAALITLPGWWERPDAHLFADSHTRALSESRPRP
ncbi:MAG TPA: TraM recognition domain-containing protein [Dermatophilaceae bacterium]|nr:TraM recognition domain-containing protein [Dermatophilaceae bacterium]